MSNMDSPNDPRAKLFIGGLNRETTDDKLREYFEPYGELTDVVVITDSQTKLSRGFGYVTFSDFKVTRNVLKDKVEKGSHMIDGKEVEVKRAIPRDNQSPTAHEKTKKVFIGGLTEDTTEDDIRQGVEDVLEEEVKSVDLIKKKEEPTKHRGFCFIELNYEDHADELCCVQKLLIKGKMVECKKATPRDRDRQEGGGRGGRGGGRGGRGGYAGGGYNRSGGSSYGSGYDGFGGYGQTGGYGGYDYNSGYGYDGYNSGGRSMYGPSSTGYSGARGRGGSRYQPY